MCEREREKERERERERERDIKRVFECLCDGERERAEKTWKWDDHFFYIISKEEGVE